MKKILLISLTLVLCITCSIAPMSTALADNSGIATYSSYALNVTVNTGVASITVKYGSTSKTFTSSGSVTLSQGTSYTWTAVAEPGYTLSASSGSGTMYYPHGIGPTATFTSYTLTITLNEGVQSITVTYSSTTKTFTSSGTLSIPSGVTFTWTATAKSGYALSQSSGSGTMTAAKSIAPTASRTTYTVSVSSWEPSVIPSISVTWTLTWTTGASITANVSNYVTMTGSSDGMSVTLTKIKDFAGSNMVLTCYLTANPSVKATCTVKCES